jgi:hypothetical protein
VQELPPLLGTKKMKAANSSEMLVTYIPNYTVSHPEDINLQNQRRKKNSKISYDNYLQNYFKARKTVSYFHFSFIMTNHNLTCKNIEFVADNICKSHNRFD